MVTNKERITNAILLARLEERIISIKEHVDLKIEPIQKQLDSVILSFEQHREISLKRHNSQEKRIFKNKEVIIINSTKIKGAEKKAMAGGGFIGGLTGGGLSLVIKMIEGLFGGR